MADWTVVRTVGTEEEAALIAGYLDAAGIESRIESLLFHQEPANFGRLGEVRVMVDSTELTAAEQALSSDVELGAEAALDAAESAEAVESGDSPATDGAAPARGAS
jgi:hypothetical protein